MTEEHRLDAVPAAGLPAIPVRPCVGSGLCCKTGACAFGEWDDERHQCGYLEVEVEAAGAVVHRCGRYDFIQQQPLALISPAFGGGCCMPLFNEARARVIAIIRDDPDSEVAQAVASRFSAEDPGEQG